MAEASDFKFGMQLGFAKAHHKITPRAKNERGLGLGELAKISWFHFNTQWLKLGTSNSVHILGLRRPTMKPHPVALCYRNICAMAEV